VVSGLYPFQSHYLERDGVRLHYIDEGQGAPVVMVHGNPSWSFYYRNLAIALRDKYRVVVPDHIGCGFSDKPGDDRYEYTLENRVADLEALLDSLGIDRDITLVVHDWGGMIGFAYATRHPERIKRLVVLNTSAFRLPSTKTMPLALSIVRDTPVGAFLVRGFNLFSVGASIVGCKRNPMAAEVKRWYRKPYDSWQNRIATLRFVQDIPLEPGDRAWNAMVETEQRLESLRGVPMLICWGMKDFVFDRHFLDEWVRRFPNAETHRFEDCGHYILEDAADEVVPIIQRFVAL
jgi:cis-3-alkyl-4-acyloxetan-2-one decarboxylase